MCMIYSCLLKLKDEITMKTQELDRENRRKAKLEKDLKALQVRYTCIISVYVDV